MITIVKHHILVEFAFYDGAAAQLDCMVVRAEIVSIQLSTRHSTLAHLERPLVVEMWSVSSTTWTRLESTDGFLSLDRPERFVGFVSNVVLSKSAD